jgi:cell wall-associated NlpC family hydrolase
MAESRRPSQQRNATITPARAGQRRRLLRWSSRRPGASSRAAGLCVAALTILLNTGCASTGATPRPFPTPGGDSSSPAASGPHGAAVVATALALRGVPYRLGGTDPSGFDCSGFVSYVFAEHSVLLPRTVPEQYQFGRRIGSRSVGAGDLVFFRTTGRGPSHVGIAISADEFVHAPTSAGAVRVEPLRSRYWSSRFLGARRLH